MPGSRPTIARRGLFAALCLAAVCFCSGGRMCAAETPFRFTRLTSEDGLSYNSVKCMAQDSRGYIWIGTYKGLNRYDGTRIKSYGRLELGVQSDYINAISEDSHGNILIGTDNGIVIYDYRLDSFRRPLHHEILNDRIYDIRNDSKGVSWIGSRSGGLYCYDPESGVLSKAGLTDSEGNPVSDIYRIAIDRDDRMYLAVYCGGLYLRDGGTLSRVEVKGRADYFERDDIEGIILSRKSDNLMYIASKKHGLCELELRSGKVSVAVPLPMDSRPTNLAEAGGRVWMSTTSGLIGYSPDTQTVMSITRDLTDRMSLSDSYTTVTLPTSDEGLFVGTAYGGVNYRNPRQDLFSKFYRTSGGQAIAGCSVCGFAQGKDGVVWVATGNMGLLTFHPDTGELSPYTNAGIPERLNALCIDDDRLWIGYHKGICVLNTRTGRVKSYPHFVVSEMDIDNRVLSIFKSSDGEIFLCTSVGVMKYDRRQDSFTKLECLGDRAVENMVEDRKGLLWIASYSQGVYAYDRFNDVVAGHWNSKDGDSEVSEMVSSVCIDGNGQVWAVGFSSGFFRYDESEGRFIPYDRKSIPALTTETFFAAQSESDGTLWLASDRGLMRFDSRNGRLKVFTANSGLLEDEFNKACIRLADGAMLFGSSNGFIMFRPADFRSTAAHQDVAITGLVSGAEEVIPSEDEAIKVNIDVADKVVFRPGKNSFGFKFALPQSKGDPLCSILCRLDGYETGWRDVSTTMESFYYNVPAGKYTFHLASSGPAGDIIPAHRGITLVLRPPFWLSSAGILVLMLLFLLILVGAAFVIYRRQEAVHRRQQEETERRREKETLQEKMTFFSNVIHEIKTPLTLIRTPLQNIMSYGGTAALKDDLKIIDNSTDYLDKLVRELLDFVKVEQHGYVLDCRNVDLIDRISYICYNFSEAAKDRNLKLRFEHSEEHIRIAADDKALTKILNNLIHNAIKYAESDIRINAGLDGDSAIVKFSNDGPSIPEERRSEIFKPFVQFSRDSSEYSHSFGIGLSLAKTLSELHGGSLKLADGDKTEFILRLPLRQVAEGSPVTEEDNSGAARSLPLLLLVEDNAELQSYLKRKLKPKYRILVSASAEKALELLSANKVDMILTDIALRGMSGVELCRKVSSTHIPVVVLSAISSEETKIKCMEYGAALYIEKPFTMDYLEACIGNVLGKRHGREDSEAETSVPAPLHLVERDADFVRKLDKEILGRMGDPSFSVQELEEALYMSRSSLTRKVKGLLGTSPVDYLRSRRLAAAAEMLRAGKHRIDEVCYAVGFRSPSYFSKCFSKAYGCLPSEYASGNMKNSSEDAIN